MGEGCGVSTSTKIGVSCTLGSASWINGSASTVSLLNELANESREASILSIVSNMTFNLAIISSLLLKEEEA